MNLNRHRNPFIPRLPSDQRRKAPVLIIGILVAIVAIGSIVITFGMGGGGGNDSGRLASSQFATPANAGPDVAPTVSGTTTAASTLTPEAPPPADTPTPIPVAPASVESLTSVGAGDRLVISRFGISAPLTLKTVGSDGQMPNPDGEDDVAYYNFSSWPGFGGAPGKGGNAVFAGHVDSGFKACKYGTVPPPCTAVLWDLSKINVGDQIDVKVGGTTYQYRVTSSNSVPESSDWGPIVAATAKESITVITCGGDFNQATHSYDHRQVVKAERI